jgi:hypothetical protein
MKRIILTLVLALGLLTANAQIDRLSGPRIGFTILTHGSSADFINDRGEDYDENTGSSYWTEDQKMGFISQYGWQWETRFVDNGQVAGLVEWVIVVGGMEQGMFLPAVSSLVGIRTGSGLEAAVGPNLSLSGIGMVFTLGKNFKSGDLNFPVNIAFVPGKSSAWGDGGESTGARISLIVGFNMSK